MPIISPNTLNPRSPNSATVVQEALDNARPALHRDPAPGEPPVPDHPPPLPGDPPDSPPSPQAADTA